MTSRKYEHSLKINKFLRSHNYENKLYYDRNTNFRLMSKLTNLINTNCFYNLFTVRNHFSGVGAETKAPFHFVVECTVLINFGPYWVEKSQNIFLSSVQVFAHQHYLFMLYNR